MGAPLTSKRPIVRVDKVVLANCVLDQGLGVLFIWKKPLSEPVVKSRSIAPLLKSLVDIHKVLACMALGLPVL